MGQSLFSGRASNFLLSPIGQGALAFVVGGLAFALIGWLISLSGLVVLLYASIPNAYDSSLWSIITTICAGAVFYFPASLLAFAAVIIVMRRLGLYITWKPAMKKMLLVTIAFYGFVTYGLMNFNLNFSDYSSESPTAWSVVLSFLSATIFFGGPLYCRLALGYQEK